MNINVRGQRKVQTIGNSKGENLGQVPTVGRHGRKYAIDGEGHDGTVVEESNNQDHERREIELVREREDGKADDDTDSDGASID